MAFRRNTLKEKILLLLYAGIALGLTYSPRKQLWILRSIPSELRNIEKRAIHRVLRNLEREGLIVTTNQNTNEFSITLSKHAIARLGKFELKRLSRNRPKQWDHKWRMLIYDVSEDRKKSRDAIRRELRTVGFLELQHSVWLFPYDVQDITQLLRELYNLKNELIVLTTERFEGDKRFLKSFRLT